VTSPGSPQQVTIPAGGAATANLTDTYTDVPGTLVVTKTVTGPAADRRGQIVIITTCDGVQKPPFVIPAGASGSDLSRTYTGIPAGASCTAVETVDGHTDSVAVQSMGGKESVDVPANGTATARLVDRYTDVEGSLIVQKSITGDAAGSQGPITIQVRCDKGTPKLADWQIDAGAPAATTSHTYAGLPAGATCTVDETADGETSTAQAVVTIEPRSTTIPAGDSVTVRLADAYSFKVPDLVLEKEIATETPSGTPVDVKLAVANVGAVKAAHITVCLRLHHAFVFKQVPNGHLVRDGACWRTVKILPKRAHDIRPIVRSFVRRAAIRACNHATVEARGVDLRKSTVCTTVLAAVAHKKPGGVTG
jgi:uncharacterized protein DUF5979